MENFTKSNFTIIRSREVVLKNDFEFLLTTKTPALIQGLEPYFSLKTSCFTDWIERRCTSGNSVEGAMRQSLQLHLTAACCNAFFLFLSLPSLRCGNIDRGKRHCSKPRNVRRNTHETAHIHSSSNCTL